MDKEGRVKEERKRKATGSGTKVARNKEEFEGR